MELPSIDFVLDLILKHYLAFVPFFFFLVLKSVENLGVSYVKGTEQYQSKLESELRKLKFSYRVSKKGKKVPSVSIYVCVECHLWERYYIRHWAFIKTNVS